MPCSDAMFTNVVSVTTDSTVADAMALFDEYSIRAVPVVDAEGKLVGLFNFKTLLMKLLPASMGTEEMERMHIELSLDVFQNMGHFVAKNLQRVMALKVADVMIVPNVVKVETALREGIRLLAQHGSPIPVVDPKTHKLEGLISSQSAIKALLKIQKDTESGVKVED